MSHGSCAKKDCHIFDNPFVLIPKRCDAEKCDSCDAIKMWAKFAEMGAIGGIVFTIIGQTCVEMERTDCLDCLIEFLRRLLCHLGVILLPVFVVSSLLTTNVLRHYSDDLRLIIWAWTMVIGFGPIMFVVFMFQIMRIFSKAAESIGMVAADVFTSRNSTLIHKLRKGEGRSAKSV